MSKKKNKIWIILSVGIFFLILISAGIFAFLHFSTPAQIKTSATSSDKQATLTARFFDINGNPMSVVGRTGSLQAIVSGGQYNYNQTYYLVLDLNATNTGNYHVYNVKPSAGMDQMGMIFDNSGSTISVNFTGLINENKLVRSSETSCSNPNTAIGCDANEWCIGASPTCKIKLNNFIGGTQPTKFTIALNGTIYNALAQLVTPVNSAPTTLSFTILNETCSDGTWINNCSITKPQYCQFVQGSAPVLIDSSGLCGCPYGTFTDGNGGCVIHACYQEDATSSTVGDGTCGLTYTGIYSGSGGLNWAYSHDDNWITAWQGGSTANYMYVNYTKPPTALNTSLWRVKDYGAEINISIDPSCWNYNSNTLLFRVQSFYGAGSTGLSQFCSGDKYCHAVEWACYNGNWIRLREVEMIGSSNTYNKMYEEGMNWATP